MTKEELELNLIKKFKELNVAEYTTKYGDYYGLMFAGAEIATKELQKQIQIDAEQIRALQKQNGELTDELAKKADTNHQLVEQMAKLNEENAELKQAEKGKVVEHFEAYGQCRDSRRIAELEKENAELKADNDARKFAMAMSEKVEKQLREENSKLKEALEGYKKIAKWCDKCELEKKISILLSCKNCPENKGGLICQKEYEDKCLAQKIQYIKELQEEQKKWKDEWQEQVQKATDEGYARTLQTMKLTKATELLKRWVELSKPKLEGYPKRGGEMTKKIKVVLTCFKQTSYEDYTHFFKTVEIEVPYNEGEEWHVCGEEYQEPNETKE